MNNKKLLVLLVLPVTLLANGQNKKCTDCCCPQNDVKMRSIQEILVQQPDPKTLSVKELDLVRIFFEMSTPIAWDGTESTEEQIKKFTDRFNAKNGNIGAYLAEGINRHVELLDLFFSIPEDRMTPEEILKKQPSAQDLYLVELNDLALYIENNNFTSKKEQIEFAKKWGIPLEKISEYLAEYANMKLVASEKLFQAGILMRMTGR